MNRIQVVVQGWNGPPPMVPGQPWEEQGFDIKPFAGADSWHVWVTVGRSHADALSGYPPDVRRRWLHYDTQPDPVTAGVDIMTTFIKTTCDPEGDFQFYNAPLVSVITPTHGRGGNLERCLRSLQNQTYQNWEWVIYINNTDTLLLPSTFFNDRTVVVRDSTVPASIGAIKRRAFGVARGQLLLEFDHDDELPPNALQDLVDAATAHPECGFFYSDCAEVEDGTYEPRTYGEGWGLGYGSYRTEGAQVQVGNHLEVKVLPNVTNYPPINATTLSHIVGVPNHFRAWRRAAYHAAGGHSPGLFVADDYELILRTFLATRFCHIQKLGYIQHETTGVNSQDSRRPEIQRLVRWIWGAYRAQVVERCERLVKDGEKNPEHLEVRDEFRHSDEIRDGSR